MIEKATQVFGDDRGVSPVIGVILMVAITVILAAVIGTFVIGIGDDVEAAPQAQLSIDSVDGDTNVSIEHNGGDALDPDDLTLRFDDEDAVNDSTELGFFDDLGLEEGDFSAGDSVELTHDGDNDYLDAGDGVTTDVSVIHEPTDSILRQVELDLQDP